MRELQGKSLKIFECEITEDNRVFNGYKVEIELKNKTAIILLAKEELLPIFEMIFENSNKSLYT